MPIKYKLIRAITLSTFFVLAMGAGSAHAALIGAPVACPMVVPYCPYGGHAVIESDGCTETVCNSAPTISAAPTITSISPTSGTAPETITINGSNLAGATAVDFYNANNQLSTGGAPQSISSNGTSLTYYLDQVANGMLDAGTYQVKVVTPSGTSNGESFTFTPTVASAAFSSFSASPTSISSGQMTTLSWSGTGISQVNMTVTCPSGMSSPDGHGGDACGRTSESPAGVSSTQLLLSNTTSNSQQVTITASAYDANNALIGTRYAYVTVAPATQQTPTAAPTITIISPAAGTQVSGGSNLTIDYSTSGSFSTPGGVYFVYLKEKPDQLLGNNSVSNTYDPLVFRASSLPYPLTVTLPTVADGWSGPAYLEIDYTDNSANVIASATSGELTITDSSSSSSGYPTLSSFTVSPNSIASGQMTTISYVGTDLPTVNLSVTCPFGVSSPDGHGGDSCGRTSTFADGANSTQLQFINSDQSSEQVEVTLSAYNTAGSLVGTKSAYVTVAPASAPVSPVLPAPGPVAGSGGNGSPAQAAIRQELVQLITLLLQLLQQSGAQGLVSSSQLNSLLGTASQ